jgi:hypothetical protein
MLPCIANQKHAVGCVKAMKKPRQVVEKIGGASRDRTDELIVANDGICRIISLPCLHLAAEYGPLRSNSEPARLELPQTSPSLFKQDPRYFYRGTGSTKKRILYAISNSVWCKGDNGRWQVNYSNIAGVASGAALVSTYYPSTNQGMEILQDSLIRMGESSLAGVVQEFVLRKLTKGGHRQESSVTSEQTVSVDTPSKP